MNKKGDEKYYIIISLILGIMILALSLYFIFQEYFNEEEIDWEVCRQSIKLRNLGARDDSKWGWAELTKDKAANLVKSRFPLKCQTEVVDINYNFKEDFTEMNSEELRILKLDVDKDVCKQVGDLMLSSWYIMGNGEYDIFPRNIAKEQKHVLIFYRVRFSEEIQEFYSLIEANKDGALNSNCLGKYGPKSDEALSTKIVSLNEAYQAPKNVRKDSYEYYFGIEYKENFLPKGDNPLDYENIFLDNDNEEDSSYGVPRVIKPNKGDLLVGTYYYYNRDYFIFKTLGRYPFFVQPDLDKDWAKGVSIETIPA